MPELSELLYRPNAQVEERVAAALDSGPIHPDEALRFAELVVVARARAITAPKLATARMRTGAGTSPC